MSAYGDFATMKLARPIGFCGLPVTAFCNFFFTHIFSVS